MTKSSRWPKRAHTPQFTSGPLVPLTKQWRQQSPPSQCSAHLFSCLCWSSHQKNSQAAAILDTRAFVLWCPLGSRSNVCFVVFFPSSQIMATLLQQQELSLRTADVRGTVIGKLWERPKFRKYYPYRAWGNLKIHMQNNEADTDFI